MNKLDAAFNFHQTALRVRNQRQEILASNIANADTPNYKARDIDFKSAMSQALSGGASNSGGLNTTDSQQLNASPNQGWAGNQEPLFRPVIQGAVDGNTVDMDVERNQFVDNSLRYEASITMMNGQIKKLLSAITGQ
jgi:flagellar basal-body rod protein FlgB